ncbi:MAG: aminotransferase class I/II-fold pyridoxal phosphate-dependent enzyme [Synergistaceae bacterium]|nr:aminotransferase class I/II-fold pyridoxal phosphate-dependent enzyme [Synergistaceae bacterium]
MYIKDFKVEKWLNPRDPYCRYNLGASCVKAISLDELTEISGENKEELTKYFFETHLHYGAFFGLPRLLEAIASIYKNAVPGRVLTFHGGTGANSSVLTGMLEKGDNVVAVMPNYQQHYSIPEALGIEVRPLRLNKEEGYKVDPERLEALADSNTKLITLTNPNNPTGAYMNADDLYKIISIAEKNGSYILCDEIYRGLADEYMPSIIDLYDKGISTGSMSKIYSMAGTRVGWAVVGDKKAYDILENRRSYDSICNGVFDELISAIALENSPKMLVRARDIVRPNKKIVDEWIRKQPALLAYGETFTTTMLVHYDYDINEVELCTDIYEKTGVLLCHGDCFEEKKCFRLGFGFGDRDLLQNGLETLGEYFEKL